MYFDINDSNLAWLAARCLSGPHASVPAWHLAGAAPSTGNTRFRLHHGCKHLAPSDRNPSPVHSLTSITAHIQIRTRMRAHGQRQKTPPDLPGDPQWSV